MNGISDQLPPKMLEFVLNTIRIDYRLYEEYAELPRTQCTKTRCPPFKTPTVFSESLEHDSSTKLRIPITSFNPTHDPIISVADQDNWAPYTTGSYTKHIVRGDHFYFINDFQAQNWLIDQLSKICDSV